MSGCNGWTNWETWIVSMHFGDYFAELAGEYTRDEWDAEVLKTMVEEILDSEGAPTTGIQAEFINGCMSSVNWYELASHYEPEEDEDDGQPDEAQEWADFDADC